MKKIKEFLSKMLDTVKSAFNNFPITVIIVFILTVIITIEEELFGKETFEILLRILGLTASGTFLSEVIFPKNKKKYIGIGISAVIAIVVDRICVGELIDLDILGRWVTAYILICGFLSVYFLAKKVDKMEEYTLNTYLNIKKNTIYYAVLCIGFMALYGIFYVLISKIDFEIISKIITLFTGFYYVPVILNSFTTSETGEDTKFNKTLFTKVLLTLLCAAMFIVYIYIFKLIFVTGIPKNEVFFILSSIFVCLLPLVVINKNYCKENDSLSKIIKALPVLFIPFIFLQIYTMGLRILDYGITEDRYAAIVLIIFEIISIFVLLFKDGKYLKELFLCAVVFTVVAFISPINMEKAELLSQESIVKRFATSEKQFNDMTIKEQRKYAGAYQNLIKRKDYNFNINITNADKGELRSFNNFYDKVSHAYEVDEENPMVYENCSESIGKLDISEYSRINKVSEYFSNYYSDDDKKEENKDNSFLNKTITVGETSEKYEVNLSDLVSKIIEGYDSTYSESDKIFEENNVIKIDDKTDLFVEGLDIRFNVKTDVIEYVSLEGYILERK